MIMRSYWLSLRSTVLIGAIGMALPGCDSVLTPFVGQSKEAASHATPAAPPPSPPPTTAFVNDSVLSPRFAGQTILPPTLPTAPDTDAVDDFSTASTGPHQVIAAVPLSTDPKALEALSAAANREQGGAADMRFVLLVLAPPAADAATLDRNNNAARLAATTAVKVLGDGGIAADRIEVSMATSPTDGPGELRLYRR
jgi:hypothetical protein